ncbi:MAG: serine/threonine-protein kinase, partial [Cyanobacteria bacterium P01_H01_bin.119]
MGRNLLKRFQPDPARLGGRYQVISQLGEGGFGQTFLARDLHLPGQPQCVVKQLKPQSTTSQALQTARRLFDTEAQVLYELGNHPQIPSLLAHFEERQEFYLAQELIVGHSLEDELAESSWSSDQVLDFLHDLLDTLAFVHDHQVIHRDLKPSNLMRRDGDRRIVLIDFGAVKQVSTQSTPSRISHTISIGTAGYMPNEQVAGRPQFSSDIYAVGAIAIQALTGQRPDQIPLHPQTGELDWQPAPNCDPNMATFLIFLVRYVFRSRYATAGEALAALQAFTSAPR